MRKVQREKARKSYPWVTGSGKTEIYLNMIDVMLRRKKNHFISSEISLTTQMVERVMEDWRSSVYFTQWIKSRERYDQWKRIISERLISSLGPFCPICPHR